MEVEVWEGLSHPHPQLEWCALGGGDSGLLPSPVSHLSSSPWTSRRKNYPLHPPAPRPPRLVPHTHPRWPTDPFPHLFFPSSEKSLAPEPAPAESFLSPLPLPRGPPPAIAPATTSVPLNRFLLHVNTYYRKGEDGAASHYPEDIFRGSRRSGGSEGNLRTSERGPLSCPRTVVCTSLGTTNPESDPQLPPRAHLPLASPPRCSSLASKPRRWGSTDPPRGRSGAQRPPPRSPRPRTRLPGRGCGVVGGRGSSPSTASWLRLKDACRARAADPLASPRSQRWPGEAQAGGAPSPRTHPRHIPPHPLSGFGAFIPERPYTLNGSSLPASLELPLEALGLNINQPEL